MFVREGLCKEDRQSGSFHDLGNRLIITKFKFILLDEVDAEDDALQWPIQGRR